MRVAILGVGGLGRTLAFGNSGPIVGSLRLLLTDQFGERARSSRHPRSGLDRGDPAERREPCALGRAIKGSDIVVNTTLPRYNLRIMEAPSKRAPTIWTSRRPDLRSRAASPGFSPSSLGRTTSRRQGGPRSSPWAWIRDLERDGPRRRGTLRGDRRDSHPRGGARHGSGPGYLPLSSREAFLPTSSSGRPCGSMAALRRGSR